MALNTQTFRETMLASLPIGPMWPTGDDSHWAKLFESLAPEFVEIDQLNEQLIQEMNPSTASLLFDEWEQELGLPDPCITSPQTLTQRRAAMIERYNFVGRQDKQFFIDLAARVGFNITIDEFSESSPGPSGLLTVVRPSGETFQLTPQGEEWNYVWRVNAPATTNQPRRYPSRYGEPYRTFGNELLECTIRQFAHMHRILIFAYV